MLAIESRCEACHMQDQNVCHSCILFATNLAVDRLKISRISFSQS
jgi:hypothetical protein